MKFILSLILICGALPSAQAEVSGRAGALPLTQSEGNRRAGALSSTQLEGNRRVRDLSTAQLEGNRRVRVLSSAQAEVSELARVLSSSQDEEAKAARAKQSKSAKRHQNQGKIKLSASQKKKNIKEYLWKGDNVFQPEKNMAIHFVCDLNNKLSVSFITSKPAPKGNGSAIVRVLTGNAPPSGKGYKKFIYVAEFSERANRFYVKRQELNRFMRGLAVIKNQAFKNEQMANREYQEKIEYCEKQPEDKRQQCFSSSSGYQPSSPSILIELDVEGSAGKEFLSVLSPSEADNVKNFCQKTAL